MVGTTFNPHNRGEEKVFEWLGEGHRSHTSIYHGNDLQPQQKNFLVA